MNETRPVHPQWALAQDLRPCAASLMRMPFMNLDREESLMSQSKVWISVLILLIVGLHALPVLSYQRNRQSRWPILSWTMYAKSFPPGPIQTTRRRIMGRTLNGKTDELTARYVGMSGPGLGTWYIQPLWTGDSAAAQQLLSRLNRDREDPFVEVWVEGERYTLSDSGVVKEDLHGTTFRAHHADQTRN